MKRKTLAATIITSMILMTGCNIGETPEPKEVGYYLTGPEEDIYRPFDNNDNEAINNEVRRLSDEAYLAILFKDQGYPITLTGDILKEYNGVTKRTKDFILESMNKTTDNKETYEDFVKEMYEKYNMDVAPISTMTNSLIDVVGDIVIDSLIQE